MVYFHGREGIEVAADDGIAADELSGEGRIVVAHCEIIANGKDGKVQFRAGERDKLHVHREGRVASEVKAGVVVPDDEAARVATVGAVGQHAGVGRIHIFHPTKIKAELAAVVHAVAVDALAPVVGGDFVIGDDGGVVLLRNALGIRHMVAVAVREQHVVRLDFINVHIARRRVWRDEGVEDEGLAPKFYLKTGMAVVSDFHTQCLFFSGAKVRSCGARRVLFGLKCGVKLVCSGA